MERWGEQGSWVARSLIIAVWWLTNLVLYPQKSHNIRSNVGTPIVFGVCPNADDA